MSPSKSMSDIMGGTLSKMLNLSRYDFKALWPSMSNLRMSKNQVVLVKEETYPRHFLLAQTEKGW